MKKIAWIDDFCPACNRGGTALNDWSKIKFGLQRGYDISVYSRDIMGALIPEHYDLLVFGNIVSFPLDEIKKLVEARSSIFYFHDFGTFCRWRLFYPKTEKCKSCKRGRVWLPVLQKARKLIWLSPLHRECYLHVFPELEGQKACVPSSVDTELFKPVEGITREAGTVLSVNGLEEFKGRDNLLKYAREHPELRFTVVDSSGYSEKLPDNVVTIPPVPNNELPALYSQFESFFHQPYGYEPCGRTVLEAYLCGCKIIHNGRVGALSYPWDYSNLEDVRKRISWASLGFWETIELEMKWNEEMGWR